jgi:hypothetical protein
MTHFDLFLAVMRPVLSALVSNQHLRPTYTTAAAYWLAPPDRKVGYRPTKSSRYNELVRAAMAAATQEEKGYLKQIKELGDDFLPLGL